MALTRLFSRPFAGRTAELSAVDLTFEAMFTGMPSRKPFDMQPFERDPLCFLRGITRADLRVLENAVIAHA